MGRLAVFIVLFIGIANALPDPASRTPGSDGIQQEYAHKHPKYNPDFDNQYHLFTRLNPQISQPLIPFNGFILMDSHYSSQRRSIILIHGWNDNVVGGFSTSLVSAFLQSDDVNVITIDWSGGAYMDAETVPFAVRDSGLSVARFVNWLKDVTFGRAENFHIVGFSLGSHHAAVTSRHINGGIGYLTGLDPSSGGFLPEDRFHYSNAFYTEAIYTNSGMMGFRGNLAHVNFYPNGGNFMPGCGADALCNHIRAFLYFGEAIAWGGFTGIECNSMEDALVGRCYGPRTMTMGSRSPRFGETGTFFLETNAHPPYSRG